jgi:hypothetical protein
MSEERESMNARFAFVLGIAAIALLGLGQSESQAASQDRYVLSAPKIAQALSLRGLTTKDAHVFLPARVVATEPDPALDVLSVSSTRDRRSTVATESVTWIKLTCRLPGRCLPFYAMVKGATGPYSDPAAPNAAQLEKPPVAIRAGAQATLMMDDNRAHIQISVVSLENGVAGHRIRVATLDHKHTYTAEVVSAQLLKRSF